MFPRFTLEFILDENVLQSIILNPINLILMNYSARAVPPRLPARGEREQPYRQSTL